MNIFQDNQDDTDTEFLTLLMCSSFKTMTGRSFKRNTNQPKQYVNINLSKINSAKYHIRKTLVMVSDYNFCALRLHVYGSMLLATHM